MRKQYAKELAKLYREKATPDEIGQFEQNRYGEMSDARQEIETFLSDKLVFKARELDVRLPPSDDKSFWTNSDPFTSYLNSAGRDLMRTRIKEVKDRNFDDKARWLKFLMPLIIALLTGIVGALVGFFIGQKK